jgi:hypothetical protein
MQSTLPVIVVLEEVMVDGIRASSEGISQATARMISIPSARSLADLGLRGTFGLSVEIKSIDRAKRSEKSNLDENS